MKLIWSEQAWDDYLYRQSQDKKTLKRINQLIKDIRRFLCAEYLAGQQILDKELLEFLTEFALANQRFRMRAVQVKIRICFGEHRALAFI